MLEALSGSGTTLIAAEKVGRICHAVELDPAYLDLAIRRWQAWTGEKAVHQASGRLFDEIEARARHQRLRTFLSEVAGAAPPGRFHMAKEAEEVAYKQL